MLNKIKELADEALKLQNKNRMDEVLREISAMCTPEESKNSVIETVADGERIESGAMVVKTTKGVKQAKGVKADE